MERIQGDFEKELDDARAALDCDAEGVEIGGLHCGIDEVASNVTYMRDDIRISGDRRPLSNRLSLHEYEAIS